MELTLALVVHASGRASTSQGRGQGTRALKRLDAQGRVAADWPAPQWIEDMEVMGDWAVPPAPKAGAGVLDLLRQFGKDEAAADRYAASCLAKARAIEPKLRAFRGSALRHDTPGRPALGHSRCDQGYHRNLGHADDQRLADL
jgi:hypothetical protein